jgi:Tol biopolymer transport system component
MRLDRGQILPVHLFTVPGHFDIVAWSDDRARVALLDRQEKRGLYLADANGRYLQFVDWDVGSVAWSPNSNAIVYTKIKQGYGLPTEIRLFEVVSEKRCIVYDPQAHMGKKSPFPMDSRVFVYDWQMEVASVD